MPEYLAYIKSPRFIRKFDEFKEKYQHFYSEEAWDYIESEFYRKIDSKGAPDILMQIYTELELNNKGTFFYKRHLKLLKELFPISGNILEVCSGYIPSFANLIANEQLKLNSGTITIYEPNLVNLTPKHPNMTLHKEEFTLSTEISQYDLVTALLPCEATETIIESACRNRKDFYIAMCGCVHTDLGYFYGYMSTSPIIYQNQVIEVTKRLLEEYDNGTLEVTHLTNHPINYPILYNRR